ncbi:uncharacterized protein [Anas platyrhynchos]|uniref:uncharacterized protein isoform X2 n=1 Tax=Anas platyrhynchos TaxID=8839 RepID=UPI003AF2B9F3
MNSRSWGERAGYKKKQSETNFFSWQKKKERVHGSHTPPSKSKAGRRDGLRGLKGDEFGRSPVSLPQDRGASNSTGAVLPGGQMGSACFPWLSLLLLSGLALRPGIAAPTGGPAERTNGFSSDNTHVTVYRCKDCDSEICRLSNYESFDKIGETQNGTFSNDIIQLLTTETQIIMCFQQEIQYLNEVYAIVVQTDWGIGESCGNLELGENEVHHITEEEKICCAVETEEIQPHVANLNCYVENKISSIYQTPDNITPDNPTDPDSSKTIGITATFLILGVCAAALALYCVQRTRSGQGRVVVLYQIFKGAIKPNQACESGRSQPFEASSTNETNQALMPAASSNKV